MGNCGFWGRGEKEGWDEGCWWLYVWGMQYRIHTVAWNWEGGGVGGFR